MMNAMDLTYDAFISYKRNGGTAWAELLYLALEKIKKKDIYIDRHSIRGGEEWETSLLMAIKSSANIIVIIFPDMLSMCFKPDDVFVMEIKEALRIQKLRKERGSNLRIIPFYVEDFSSEKLHSLDIYKHLPKELKEITSTGIQDMLFDKEYPYAWIDKLSESLLTKESIMAQTHYMVQINPLCDMTVYNDVVANKKRKLKAHGKATTFWVRKQSDRLILHFVANDGKDYMVTIDTSTAGNDNISWFNEYQAYFYVYSHNECRGGVVRFDKETCKIIVGVQWDLEKLSMRETVINVKDGESARVPDRIIHLDNIINPILYKK